MKVKILLLLATLLIVMIKDISNVKASTDLDNLNPNQYNETEFTDNTEFLHNDSLLESKNSIPEELKPLTFIPGQYNPNKIVFNQLFTQNQEHNKTIAIESKQLQLFSGETKNMQENLVDEKNETNNFGLKMVYFSCLVGLLLVVLIILLPKMTQGVK